jgi:hypothetical protein
VSGQASRKSSFVELIMCTIVHYLLSSFPYFSLAPGRRHTLLASAGLDMIGVQ